MMWTGSNFDYNGTKCTFIQEFNPDIKLEDRVDTALSWFLDKKTPANLVMLYLDEPDEHGHAYGPESDVVKFLETSSFYSWKSRKIIKRQISLFHDGVVWILYNDCDVQ